MSMVPVYPYKRTDPVVCSRFDLRVESATLIRCGNADYASPLRLPDADVAAQFKVFPPNSLRIEAGNFAD